MQRHRIDIVLTPGFNPAWIAMLYIKCHRHGIYGFGFVNGLKLLPDGQAGVITK